MTARVVHANTDRVQRDFLAVASWRMIVGSDVIVKDCCSLEQLLVAQQSYQM